MIIGISGKAGVGKSTAAHILCKHFGMQEISWADPFKKVAMEWWDLDENILWGPSENRNKIDDRYNFSARQALQHIGMSIRELDNLVWIRVCMNNAKKLLSNPYGLSYDRKVGVINKDQINNLTTGVIFSDCRFSVEIENILQENGILIRIHRPMPCLADYIQSHISEVELDNMPDNAFHYVVHNSGSLAEFEDTIVKIGEKLCSSRDVPLSKQLSFNF